MIRIYYHIAAMNDWQSVVAEQDECLYASCLYDAVEYFHVNFAGAGDCEQLLTRKPDVIERSNLSAFEFPALMALHRDAQPGDKILYIHTKGVSHVHPHRQGSDEWRRYMMWGCVEHWREMLDALDSNDMAGVQWTELNGYYARKCCASHVWAGNFWWATGEHIRRLSIPRVTGNRWLAEGWPASRPMKRFEFHNLTGGKLISGGSNPTGPNVPGFGRHCYTEEAPMRAIDKEYAQMWPYKCRTDILNHAIRKRGYKRYCEIGVYHGANLRNIKCASKISADPTPRCAVTHALTSDAFFAQLPAGETFDIYFIDGLHIQAQVAKDVENALQHLAPGGMIMLHDCLPETEFEQRDIAQYEDNGTIWNGTVWKAWAELRMTRGDLRMRCVDVDFGCGIIELGAQELYPVRDLSWASFVQCREGMMGVVSARQAYDYIETGRQ